MKARKIALPKVHLRPIGRVIRYKQAQLRAAKRGLPADLRRAIDVKIKALDKHYAGLVSLCGKFDPWNYLADIQPYRLKGLKRKTKKLGSR